MLQGLKTLFEPKSVLGLQIGPSFIAGVQVSSPGYSPLVDRMFYQEVNEPDGVIPALQQLLQREGIHPELLVTSIPTGEAAIRAIEVDFQNYRKLEKIIKYQTEPHLPNPIEEMVVDFFPSEQERSVLTFGVRKEVLSSHLSALSEIHMVPQVVSLEDVALFLLYLRSAKDRGDEPVAILHASGGRDVVQVVRKGKLDFIRVLPGSRELWSQLQESLSLYAMKNRDPLKEILITGRSALGEAAPERVTQRTGIPASLWKPFDQVRHGFGEMAPETQTRMSVPLGLALSIVNGGRKFNLRKEEFAFRESLNLRSLLVYMLCALVLFFGLFTFHLYRKVSVLEEAHNRLNVRIRQIFTETFPGASNFVRGKEAVQMAQRISAETTQYQWLEEAAGRGSVLETLLVLHQRLAGVGDVQVDNLSVEAEKINLDGRSSSFKKVDDLKARLGEPGLFKSVKLLSAKMDSREQAVLFNFVLEKGR